MRVIDILTEVPIARALQRHREDDEWTPFVVKLIEIAEFLETVEPAKCLYALYDGLKPPTLLLLNQNKASIRLWADHCDRSEFVDPASDLHVRMQISRDGSKLSRDVRTRDLNDMARQIRLAFGLPKS